VEATKRWFHEDLNTLRQWLPWVNSQVGEYNAVLESKVRQRVLGRRQELESERQQVVQLGFKVRDSGAAEPKEEIPSRERQARREEQREKAGREYDVALSFAGEDRPYIEQVATGLQDAGVSVFYDGFEQVNLWGKDLAEHLGEVYGKRSRFVVVVSLSGVRSEGVAKSREAIRHRASAGHGP